MTVARRLTVAGGGDDGVPVGPGVITRTGDKPGDVGLDADGFAVGPRQGVDFEPTDFIDLRGARVIVVTTDAAGADTFTLSFQLDPGPDGTFSGTVDVDGKFTTGTIEDNDNAATIQAAIRAAIPGTDLTVVTGDAPGPFTITFDPKFYSRRYPRVTGTGTGCTVTVSAPDPDTQAPNTAISAAGESHQVSPTDSILAPTLGTVTETTPAVNEVHTLNYSPGTDGGTVSLGLRAGTAHQGDKITGGLDWDSTYTEVQAALDALVDDAPNVAGRGTSDVQTLELNDISDGDTFKLTHNAIESALITFASIAADNSTLVQDAIEGLAAFIPGDVVVTKTDDNTYVLTFEPSLGPVSAFTITSPTGFTPTGVTDTATGVQDGFTFTFVNGQYGGGPNGAGIIYVHADLLTDGGVLEPAVLTVTTPGVLSSTSAAYTENGGGDAVLVAAVNDATGESFGFILDAASPIVFTLRAGDYHLVARTVEDGRVSKAANKAFTVTAT